MVTEYVLCKAQTESLDTVYINASLQLVNSLLCSTLDLGIRLNVVTSFLLLVVSS